jgi:hypothetical membrane protein
LITKLFLAYSGVIAALWALVGVAIAAKNYKGYSHAKQFLSELGAKNSPVEKLSPIINNYPLGLLLTLFGGHLIYLDDFTVLFYVGWLVILHGICTWVTGYFPMDTDPYTKSPSLSCKVHTLAGSAMSLSLLIAPFLCLLSNVFPTTFKLFTLACLLISIVFMLTLAKAFNNKTNLGTHQRISYSAQLVWLSGLSILVAQ